METSVIDTEQAKSLAVRYGTFMAISFEDYRAIATWGDMLLEIQDETGVVMYRRALLKAWVDGAKTHLRD